MIELTEDAPPQLRDKPLKIYGLNLIELKVIAAAQSPTDEQVSGLSHDCLASVAIQNFIKLRNIDRNKDVLATKIRRLIEERGPNGFEINLNHGTNQVIRSADEITLERRRQGQEGDDPFIALGFTEEDILEVLQQGVFGSQFTSEKLRYLIWANSPRKLIVLSRERGLLETSVRDLMQQFQARGSKGIVFIDNLGDTVIRPFAVYGPVMPFEPERPLCVYIFALPALPEPVALHGPADPPIEANASDVGVVSRISLLNQIAVAAAHSRLLASNAWAIMSIARKAAAAAGRASQVEQILKRRFDQLRGRGNDSHDDAY